jgi:conjugal transfer/type IV secretion protein DotA/TraY
MAKKLLNSSLVSKATHALASLAFVFCLCLSPQPAAAGPIKTATGQGAFDCLNSGLDWGCEIISFLFENKPITYVKNGVPSAQKDQPGIVESSLRAMMGFFSNAILIIASLKLLYELIQMVAETAHSGQVGGKEANQLWAPIRLVVAIGLLVPLSDGMNSGQHIIIQISKWGSGLASQTWAVFVENLSANQKLASPTPPRIQVLDYNTLKSLVCVELVNYYAKKINLDAEKIPPSNGTTGRIQVGKTEEIRFSNKKDESLCGTISFRLPNTGKMTPQDESITRALTAYNEREYLIAYDKLQAEAKIIADLFLPDGDDESLKSTEQADKIIIQHQKNINDGLAKAVSGITDMSSLTGKIKDAANIQGWTSAGSWFLAITRAQGQIFTGGMNIPEVSPPDTRQLGISYEGPAKAYARFLMWLERSPCTQCQTIPSVTPPDAERMVNDESSMWKKIESAGGVTIDWLLDKMDKMAVYVGLWESDPRRAFGDLGSTQNPFGEISALGHKKIRLGLNYLGLAFMASAGSGAMDTLSNLIPGAGPRGPSSILHGMKGGISAIGKVSGAAVVVITAIATLFLLAGVMLGFVVPLFPFVRFFFAILTWLGTLIEAMISVPFIALAHLTPKGEGFTGQNARTAYYLVFQVFLRPTLTLFGLIGALLMFYIAAKFLNSMFYEATNGIAIYEGGMKFMQKMVYSLIYAGLIYISANISFKMIDQIPRHALRWMGSGVQEESYDDHSSFMQIAGAVGGQQLISNFTSLPKNMGDVATALPMGIGNKVAERRNEKTALKRHAEEQRALGNNMNVNTGMIEKRSKPEDIKAKDTEITSAEATAHAADTDYQREVGVLNGMPENHPDYHIQERKVSKHERLSKDARQHVADLKNQREFMKGFKGSA